MDFNLDDIRTAFDLFKNSINLFRTAKDLLPNSPEKEAATKSIDQAEKYALVAEANAAKALGYPLCKCTWPPQIMINLSCGSHIDSYKCNKCNKTYKVKGKREGKQIIVES